VPPNERVSIKYAGFLGEAKSTGSSGMAAILAILTTGIFLR
jgi:hypothetical protein